MKDETKTLLKEIMESFSELNYIIPENIPNIDLYMDQVTSFMEEQLSGNKRYEEDKILTKTMINNYTKNHLLPPSDKKKYSKEHVLLMTFIYYFKNILTIKDIERILNPITEKYFHNDLGLDVLDIYQEVMELEKSRISTVAKDIARSCQSSTEHFTDQSPEDQDFLQTFALICNLSFDVYVKKMIMQKLIDELPELEEKKKKKQG